MTVAESTEKPQVSEQIFESLLTQLNVYAAESCQPTATQDAEKSNKGSSSSTKTEDATEDQDAIVTVAAEKAAAKMERMGYSVGYRLCERLAQNKTWTVMKPTTAAAASSGASAASSTATDATTKAQAVAAQQLEAVKFLCKEVWTEVFGKQIDKLQTNHRGVFVLKDHELKLLTRFPPGTELARVTAIRLLAFPCGIVRGVLANLGIPAVVSCDFLADGQNMAACCFNIKVK